MASTPITPTPAPAPAPAAPTVLPKLPNWLNAGSVTAFGTVVLGYVLAFLVALDPGIVGTSVLVKALLPSVGVLVATGATLYLVITHRATTKAIAASGGSVTLPTWTDPASVTTFISTILGAVFGILTLLHPGFSEPAVVHAVLPSVGLLVAAVAQIVNVATHHGVVKAAAVRALSVA